MANKKETFDARVVVRVENEEAIGALVKELDRLRIANSKAAKPMQQTAKQLKQTQIEARRFGRSVQNSSYQIQDFITQVAGGVDPIKSLGQQLPQMVINMGALGGAIGVAAAALPFFIDNIEIGDKAAKEADVSFDSLSASISRIGTTMSEMNLDSFVEQWEKVGKAQQDALLATLKYDTYLAKSDINKAFESFAALPEAVTEAGPARVVYGAQLQTLAETIGLTEKQFRGLIDSYEAVQNEETRNIETITKFRTELMSLAQAEGIRNEALEKTIKNMKDAESAAIALTTANDALLKEVKPQVTEFAEYLKPGGGGGSNKESDMFPRIVPNAGDPEILAAYKAQQEALKEQQAAYAALYPEMTRYLNTLEQITTLEDANRISTEAAATARAEALEKLNGEPFSLAVKGVELFNSSFQKMLDGVVQGTQSISDGFKDMAKVIIAELARIAILKSIVGIFGGTSSLGTAATNVLQNANGNAFNNGSVVPFANGGVVNGPTNFGYSGGIGLMGESGPEAIVPLNRGPGGKLGVGASPVNVTVNNMASGVEVRTRQTDSGLTLDVVMAQFATAVRQGGNDLTSAMESTYSIGRGGAAY